MTFVQDARSRNIGILLKTLQKRDELHFCGGSSVLFLVKGWLVSHRDITKVEQPELSTHPLTTVIPNTTTIIMESSIHSPVLCAKQAVFLTRIVLGWLTHTLYAVKANSFLIYMSLVIPDRKVLSIGYPSQPIISPCTATLLQKRSDTLAEAISTLKRDINIVSGMTG